MLRSNYCCEARNGAEMIEAGAEEKHHMKEVQQCLSDVIGRVIDNFTAVLVFDTETTSFNGSVIQLGYVRADDEGNEIDSSCRYLKLIDGEVISLMAQSVHHITTDMLDQQGEDPAHVIHDFSRVAQAALHRKGVVVAHNAKFDCARLEYTAKLAGAQATVQESDVFCTCSHRAVNGSNVTFFTRNGRRKRPRNDELYEYLFQRPPTVELHDALNDARVTMSSYMKGRRLNWW